MPSTRDALLPLGHVIGDNRGMGRLWLPLAIGVLLQSGCAPRSEPPPPAPSVSTPVVEKPPPSPRDEFNLPLVIYMETPETPPEIQNPSPPIRQTPESS